MAIAPQTAPLATEHSAKVLNGQRPRQVGISELLGKDLDGESGGEAQRGREKRVGRKVLIAACLDSSYITHVVAFLATKLALCKCPDCLDDGGWDTEFSFQCKFFLRLDTFFWCFIHRKRS